MRPTRFNLRGVRATTAAAVIVLLVAISPVGYASGSSEQATDSVRAAASAERLASDVAALASPQFEGRLTGSDGNIKAARYLAAALEELGYVGIDGGDILDWYTQPVILAEEPPTLSVRHGDGTIERFAAGQVDVLIREGCRVSGAVAGTVVQLPDTAPSPEWVREHKDAIVLIDAQAFGGLTSDQELMGALFHPIDSPRAIVLALPPTMETLPRGVFLTHDAYDNEGPMLAQVTADIAASIRAAGPEARLELTSHYRVAEREVPNVAAKLGSAPAGNGSAPAGNGSGRPIILSAHFDGTGDMSSRTRYPSAVDNASGTAVVLELARLLAETLGTSSQNIWVVFFNGEEQGLYGSRSFVERRLSQLAGGLVLNVDMVGHDRTAPYIVSHVADSASVARELATALNVGGLDATASEGGGSDHIPFQRIARALSIVQAPYRFMHQQRDVPDAAHSESLATLTTLLFRFLVSR